MYTRKTFGKKGLVFVTAALATVGCDVPEPLDGEGDEGEVQAVDRELRGARTFNYCDEAQQGFLHEALNIGRVVAETSEFRSCVTSAPYVPCDDDSTTDVNVALRACQSPNPVEIDCRVPPDDAKWRGQTTWFDMHQPLHGSAESFKISKRLLDAQRSKPRARDRAADVARTIWHEAMHTHGFTHGSGSDTSTFAAQCGRPPSWDPFTNAMPFIVGSCMQDTIAGKPGAATPRPSLVSARFQARWGRAPSQAEEDFYYNRMAAGGIRSSQELDQAIAFGTLLAPLGLRVTGTTGTTVDLAWTEQSTRETGFRISYRAAGQLAQSASIGPRTGSNPNVTARLTHLTPNTRYTISVKAYDASSSSPASASIDVTTLDTLPAPVTQLRASNLLPTSARIDWSHTGQRVTLFRVSWYEGGRTQSAVLPPSARHTVLSSLRAGTTYQVTVTACGQDGCAIGVSVPATTPSFVPPPCAPTGLQVRYHASTTALLSWNLACGVATWYEVQRGEAIPQLGGPRGPGGAPLPPYTWTTTQVSGLNNSAALSLTPGRLYAFRVRACNVSHCSAYAELWP